MIQEIRFIKINWPDIFHNNVMIRKNIIHRFSQQY